MSILLYPALNKLASWEVGDFKQHNFPQGKNLFDKNTITADKILNSTGVVTNAAGWVVSDYIPVVSGVDIAFNPVSDSAVAYTALYDSNKVFLRSVLNNDLIANNKIIKGDGSVRYIRTSNILANINKFQVEYGNKITDYEEYSKVPTLPNFIKPQDVNIISKEALNVSFSNLLYPTGKNLFNKDSHKPNTLINSFGTEVVATTWYTSDYIRVKESGKIIINTLLTSASAYSAFYDKDKVLIPGSAMNNATLIAQGRIRSIPIGALYFRFTSYESGSTSSQLTQVEYGEKSTEYKEYTYLTTQPNFIDTQDVRIKNEHLSVDVDNILYHGRNLFNKDEAEIGKYVGVDGGLSINNGWYASGFIPVVSGTTIKMSFSFLSVAQYSAFYDKDKKFIPGSQLSLTDFVNNGNKRTVPVGAKYFRFSSVLDGEGTKPTEIQVEYGTTSTPYKSFQGNPKLPNFTDTQDVNVVDGSPTIEGYQVISNREKYKLYRRVSGNTIVALYGNIVVLVDGYDIGKSIHIKEKGIQSGISKTVVFDAINFPNLEAGSRIEEVLIIPFTRNMTIEQTGRDYRINVITSKGQIYHNFPARATGNDGVVASGDVAKFDESVVWDIEERRFPSPDPTATGVEIYQVGLPQDNYRYIPAISQDNGYGNGGFPKQITHGGVNYARFYNPQKNQFHSFGFMGGYEPTKKLSVIGTYRSNSINEQGSRMCFFATSDGGRSWYNKYEFASLSGNSNAGVEIDTRPTRYDPNGVGDLPAYTSDSFVLKEVKHTIPSELNKEPDHLFDFGNEVVISSIVKGKPTIVTTAGNHGLINNAVIVIQDNTGSGSISSAWDWLRNDTISASSGGNGRMFKAQRLSDTTFALREYIHNPFNNISCRHIHSINRMKDGFTIGCGEFYPHGWNFYVPVHHADDFGVARASDVLNVVRLTSTEAAAKRTLGFFIKDDIENTVIFSSDEAYVPRSPLNLPAGRTVNVTRSSTGVFKGKLSDMDDFTKYECIYEAEEPAFIFKEKSGVYIFGGQRGEAALSFDQGETWVKDDFKSVIRYFRGQDNNLILIDNILIYVK